MEVCSSVTRVVGFEKKRGRGGSRKDGATSGSMKELQGEVQREKTLLGGGVV